MTYTLFIDESGEAGIKNIRTMSTPGASPYMTLGGTIIKDNSISDMEKNLEQIRADLRVSRLHCADLGHYQLLHFAKNVASQRLRLFGVISLKKTLGSYSEDISGDSKRYYNKCVQYLLERVGFFMEARGIKRDQLNIVFEKANVDYDAMKNLLRLCQKNPKRENTKRIRNINIDNISIQKKQDEPLLQVSDLVAHALYRCVDRTPGNYGITEPRYLKEISKKFFGNPESELLIKGGLYCVHKTSDLELDHDVKELLDNLTASPPSRSPTSSE